VKLTKLERADIERDLTFLGLIIMENRIKAVSSDVITELHGANIRKAEFGIFLRKYLKLFFLDGYG
jgi:hypothetical protein